MLVPPELTELIAADTIRTDRASRALATVIECSVTAAPVIANRASVSLPKRVVRAMSFGRLLRWRGPLRAFDPPALNPSTNPGRRTGDASSGLGDHAERRCCPTFEGYR